MRKCREAALVAAVVGGVSVLGAGAASAGEEEPPQKIVCNQTAETNTEITQNGLINFQGPVVGGGAADSRGTQQICGSDNDGNATQGGPATGGNGGTSVDAVAGALVAAVTG